MARIGNLSIGSGFKGGQPKPDPPELFLVMKTRWSSWVGRFRVRSGRFFEWVRYSDEYGQPSVRTGVYYIVGGFMNFLLIKLKIQKILKL